MLSYFFLNINENIQDSTFQRAGYISAGMSTLLALTSPYSIDRLWWEIGKAEMRESNAAISELTAADKSWLQDGARLLIMGSTIGRAAAATVRAIAKKARILVFVMS